MTVYRETVDTVGKAWGGKEERRKSSTSEWEGKEQEKEDEDENLLLRILRFDRTSCCTH